MVAERSARVTFLLLAVISAAEMAWGQGSCTGTNPVTCTSASFSSVGVPNSGTNTHANPYPSQVNVTASGVVSALSVTINGLTYDELDGADTGFDNMAMLLVAPDGVHNLNLMSFPDQDQIGTSLTKVTSPTTLTFTDSASKFLPCDTGFSGPPLSYKPSSYGNTSAPSYGLSGLTINFSGGTSDAGCFHPALGSSTLTTAFLNTGTQANGVWSLYVLDNGSLDVVSFSSWSITITTAAASTTSTTVASSANPSLTGNSVTFTATVTNTGGSSTPAGTVTFENGGSAITCSGGNQTLTGSGTTAQATCSFTFNSEGFQAITALYNPSGNFDVSSGSLLQFARKKSTNPSGTTYCNTGAIAISGSSPNASGTDSQPYPSVINVGTDTPGISNAVSTVQVTLTGFSASSLEDVQMLLVSPDRNHALDFFDDIGGGAGSPSASFTVADNGSSGRLPEGSGSITNNATYEPTSYANSSSSFPPDFPSIPSLSGTTGLQAPGSFSLAGPGGGSPGATFLSSFNDATANGNWTLYVFDNSSSTVSVSGGWCMTITPGTGTPTKTTASGDPNGAAPSGAAIGTAVTVTATVVNANTTSPVNEGSVVFTEDGAQVAGGPLGAVAVGSNGQASFTTSSLPEGDHNISATYTDSSNTFSESFGSYVQRVDKATSGPTVAGNVVTYCNTGAITVPAGAAPFDLGAAAPNPSNIFVSNLFGTVKSVTVSLNGFSDNDPNLLRSLLVGPADTNGTSFDFFSDVGGATAVSNLNLTLSDAAATQVPITNGSLVSGSYKPTSDGGADTYTSSASGFYTLRSGPYQYAATTGSSTFTTVFGSSNPNGLWSLYFNQTAADTGGGFSGGWCLNFTQNVPTLSIAKSHSGNFTQGQQGAQFSITVTNNGPGSAGGASPITVTDTLPAGLTPAATPGSGTNWSCGSAGQTITCTNAELVGASTSFPTLTLSVNVASNAPASLSNTASVVGSGNTTPVNSNTDFITVVTAPTLSISKSHSWNFTQGQTAVWNLAVSNTGSGASTTGGATTVTDTLPAGYTLSSFSGTGWSCSGSNSVTCTSTNAISGGASFPTLALTVNVPAASPTSVTNTGAAYGGGDPVHAAPGTAVLSNSDTVTVNQAPATISATSGSGQSVAEGASFNTLQATVLDANNQPINGVTVTFTGPASGASVIFSGTANNVATAVTNSSGVATSPALTANNNAGSYSVTANVSPALGTPAAFSLTNTAAAGPSVVSYSVLFGSESYNVTGSPRNRLPWQITGIQVVFSSTVTGSASSLGGVAVTNFGGSGTNTLTWTISPISEGSFSTTLSGSGANAILDSGNHGLNSGAGVSQLLRVLWGDFNDDGVVNAQDLTLVNNATRAAYNIFADLNGDGAVNSADVLIVRSRNGTTLP